MNDNSKLQGVARDIARIEDKIDECKRDLQRSATKLAEVQREHDKLAGELRGHETEHGKLILKKHQIEDEIAREAARNQKKAA